MNRFSKFLIITLIAIFVMGLILVPLSADSASKVEIKKLINDLHIKDDGARKKAVEKLSKMGKSIVNDVIAYLEKQEVYLGRSNACRVLGNIGDKSAVKPLVKAMKDEYADVRVYAAEALGKIKDPAAVQCLIKALDDRIGDVKAEAAKALGKIGNKKAIPHLKKLLKDSDESVKKAAKWALDRLK